MRVDGLLEIRDHAGNTRIELDGQNGEITILTVGGNIRFQLDGSGNIVQLNAAAQKTASLGSYLGSAGTIRLGGGGQLGRVIVGSGAGHERIRLIGADIDLINSAGRRRIHLGGNTCTVILGGGSTAGDLVLRSGAEDERIHLRGGTGNIDAGGSGQAGDLILRSSAGDERIHLRGGTGNIDVGGSRQAGDLILRSSAGDERIHLRGGTGNIDAGGSGQAGDLILRSSAGDERIHLRGGTGNIDAGGSGQAGTVIVRDRVGNERIRLDGFTGDISLHGADCAEEFDVLEVEPIDPGSVLVIDEGGTLHPCEKAYDKKVAGVVSGGNGCNPAIILDKGLSKNRRLAIALNGKVFCRVDTQYSPIEVGDLLTTSPTRGHAMKANDQTKAFGAVIGKALRGLRRGRGLVPILVSLQ